MYNRQFIFFSKDDAVLFHRNDAEQAEWTHQEFTLFCTFPYDPEKVITRGMRIGFEDGFGQFQLFEIRGVTDSEPDHVQDITAEHIVISELTDRHLVEYAPSSAVSAQTAITALLSNTGWSLGQCITFTNHKPELSMTNIWAALTEVRDMYGLRLEPYVTVSATAVTGRYINVIDNVGVSRGVRLSLNKNIDQVGVTYDDTSLITAVYGYGKKTKEKYKKPDNPYSDEESESTVVTDYGANYVTFKNVVWTETADHPAKPSGQLYLEDPAATALYGRNGQPRFGFYNNADVDDPEELLDLSWQALQKQNKPKVTIECTISQLYSYGYQGEQIQIGDTVRVDIEPTGAVLELMCICLTEDLLDPSNTRPTIGKFIKDIVYITKDQEHASGGGGGGGGANEDEIEQQKTVYTNFIRTDEYIAMQAVDLVDLEDAMDDAFSEIYLNAHEIGLEVTARANADDELSGRITVNAGNIALVVTNGALNASLIVSAINGSQVTINADRIDLNGYVTTSALETTDALIEQLRGGGASFSGLTCTGVISTGSITSSGGFTTNSGTFNACTVRIPNVNSGTVLGLGTEINLGHYHSITCSESGGVVTLTLGAAQSSAGTDSFNIAATQFYQDAVAAAEASGYAECEAEFSETQLRAADTSTSMYLRPGGYYKLYYKDGEDFYPVRDGVYYWYYSATSRSEGYFAKYGSLNTYYTRSSS